MRWMLIPMRQSRVRPPVDSEDSDSTSDSEQNDPPSSLASDAEQWERMQVSYGAVGRDFYDQDDLIGTEYCKLRET